MSKVYEYYKSRNEIISLYEECGEPEDEKPNDNAMKMCDGDCGNVYYLEDLYSTCYTQDFCKECMCIFLAEQEDGSVRDDITGEE